jgi:hypothetical protein
MFCLFRVAIRSGDYYMFDYESDEVEEEVKEDEATIAQEQVNCGSEKIFHYQGRRLDFASIGDERGPCHW